MEPIPELCRRAETLLGNAFQIPLTLEVLEQFESSHVVLRCAVNTGIPIPRLPGTVILKQRNFNQPKDPNSFDQNVLFRNEWASLDFMSALAGEVALGPRLYASDRQQGLVLLEDLGGSWTVQDALYDSDRHVAVNALVATGTTLGQIQGITYGREAEFTSRQTALETVTTMSDASRDLRADLEDLRACMAGLGIAVDQGFEAALHSLESAIHGPGIFRTFVHNDAGPHNYVVTPSGARLLDFEFAGYGHGLLDVVCARLAFPPAFRGRVLPAEVVRELEKRYRTELAARVPALNDDEQFSLAVSQACAHWAFSKLIGMWDYLKERLAKGEAWDTRDGRPPERAAFFRRQVFTYLRLGLASLEEEGNLPELRGALDQIVGKLLAIWPETPLLASYPAFGGEPWHYP